MSYSSCQDRLTNDQKTRARAMLSTSGISLIYSNGDQNPVSTSGSLSSGACVPQHSLTSPGSAGIMNFTITDEFSHSSSYTANDGGYVDLTSECLKVIQLDENTVYDFVVSTWFNPHNIKAVSYTHLRAHET